MHVACSVLDTKLGPGEIKMEQTQLFFSKAHHLKVLFMYKCLLMGLMA